METLNEGEDRIFEDEDQVPYKHLKKLGSGACGLVEKVQDSITDRIFARKTVQISSGRARKQMIKMYKNEVDLIRRLCTHHHIIRVFATYMTPDELGLILLPVADKGDLAKYLNAYRRLSGNANIDMRSTLIRSFGCLTNGLAFMHSKQVRHKDIKPQNILVHEGAVLFTDFGYSLDTSRLSTSVTNGRPNCFTPRYSAPEVTDYEERDSRSDVWSLGCVMIEILSALTDAFKPDEDEPFSKSMGDLHATLRTAQIPARYSHVLNLVIDMTSLTANGRPRSKGLAVRVLTQAGFGCSTCVNELDGSLPVHEKQPDTKSNITLAPDSKDPGLLDAGKWYWSAPHNDFYMITSDSTGQVVYHWAKALMQATSPTSPPQPAIYPSYDPSYQNNVSEPSVPDVSHESRFILPRHTGFTAGVSDLVDSSYRTRAGHEARTFFRIGRVFALIYTESTPETTPSHADDSHSGTRFDARAWIQIRRFVVISVRRNFVHACAISTYGNQGTLKRGCYPREHALIYNQGIDPETCYLASEKARGLIKAPIEVIAANGSTYLRKTSRVRFGRTYPVEFNIKAKDVGQVVPEHVPLLLQHFEEENSKYDVPST